MQAASAYEPYGPGTRHGRHAFAGAAIVLLVGFMAWIRIDAGGPSVTRVFVDLTSTIVPAVAAVLCALRARKVPGERGLAWWLLAAACASWALGNVAWTWLELVAQVEAFPSVADVGYLGLVIFGTAALLAMVVGSTPVTTRLRVLLDGLLIASAMLFAAWSLVLRPILAYARSQEGLTAQVLSLAYPVGDLLLLSLLVLLSSRVAKPVRGTLAWLGLALACFSLADIGYAYENALGTYATGSAIDAGWVAGFLVIGYAALRPIPILPEGKPAAPGIVLSLLPLAPFVAATAVSIWVEIREGWLEPFLFWNAIVVIMLLTTRHFVILLENIQLRRDVERSLADVRAAQSARAQMLNNITHDLGTPLTPVRLQVHLLESGPTTLSEQQARAVHVIRRNIDHVVRMVGDLKDMSYLDTGRLRLDLQETDVTGVVRQAVESLRAQAHERHVMLEVEAAEPLAVRADAVRIHQVLLNLVGNALKFTPAGGRVRVLALRDGAEACLEVLDNGRGLDPESQAKLFRPFTQVHDRTLMPSSDRGTGLGLYICKGIVEQHGGRIAVHSEGLGRGTTFTVRLPVANRPGDVRGEPPVRPAAP